MFEICIVGIVPEEPDVPDDEKEKPEAGAVLPDL